MLYDFKIGYQSYRRKTFVETQKLLLSYIEQLKTALYQDFDYLTELERERSSATGLILFKITHAHLEPPDMDRWREALRIIEIQKRPIIVGNLYRAIDSLQLMSAQVIILHREMYEYYQGAIDRGETIIYGLEAIRDASAAIIQVAAGKGVQGAVISAVYSTSQTALKRGLETDFTLEKMDLLGLLLDTGVNTVFNFFSGMLADKLSAKFILTPGAKLFATEAKLILDHVMVRDAISNLIVNRGTGIIFVVTRSVVDLVRNLKGSDRPTWGSVIEKISETLTLNNVFIDLVVGAYSQRIGLMKKR